MQKLRVAMYPDANSLGRGVSGIHTVIRAYHRLADSINVEFVSYDSDYDISINHAGMYHKKQCDIAMLHGIYFTGEYSAPAWEWRANKYVIDSIRAAISVTVPSDWVAKTIRKDFKIDPYIVEHGVFINEWTPQMEYNQRQVLWAKNRAFEDVCDPTPVSDIARKMPDVNFVTTFTDKNPPPNVRAIGLQDSGAIKKLVSSSALVLSTIKETWGLLYIEAMAAGVPVVTVDGGHVPNMVRHGIGGYCYREGNLEDMARGIEWTLEHRDILSKNARKLAGLYTWDRAVKELRKVLDLTMEKKHAYNG